MVISIENSADIAYMQKALKQAEKAYAKGEVPIGALIVDESGEIIAQGYNKVENMQCQLGHAEVEVIKKACKLSNSWRLENATLYVTLEPCSMCMGLIMLSRIKRVVFGASSPLFGYHLDNALALSLYKRKVAICGGVCGIEAAALLQKFFKNKGKR